MAAKVFAVGDLIRLKSGGPDMVVAHVEMAKAGTVWYDTQWFAGKKAERGRFNAEVVEASPKKKGKDD
jgi:uncharacterized protein YodC (DUF2158 family)